MSETDKVMNALERAVTQVIQKVTLDVTANLIETTPVDTGWAKANWVPSIGSSPELPVGSREAVSTAPQQAGISVVLTTYRFGIETARPVYVTNNVPYIGKLNAGSSLQAPSGFVQNAITKAVTQDILGLNG